MKNKKLLTVLVALALTIAVSVTAVVAVLGASDEVTVKLSDIGSAAVTELPAELGDGDTLVVICDTDSGAFIVTNDAPALNAIKYVVGDVTVITGLDLATTAVKEGFDVTGVGIAVEFEANPSLPANAAKLFGAYADYVVGVGAAGFDVNEVEVNAGKTVAFEVAVTMPAGVNVVVYDEDYNVVPSTYADGKIAFEGKLGAGYAIAPEMVAVVDGVGYPTLEAAIAAAEGSFDKPVAIIGGGNYTLTTSSMVVVGIAGDATVEVANGILSYSTDVEFEGSTYTAYALYEKDYFINTIVDAINASSGENAYSASYVDGALEFKAISTNASDVIDFISLDKLVDIVMAVAPTAIVTDSVAFDGKVVYDGKFNVGAIKDFAASKMMTLEEFSKLTSKTILKFNLTLTSGKTVVNLPVSFTLDITDSQFARMKEYAFRASKYITVKYEESVLVVYVDATNVYDRIVDSRVHEGYTIKEARDYVNRLTVKEAFEKAKSLSVPEKLDQYEDEYDAVVKYADKLMNKLENTKFSSNLEVPFGIIDKDGDGIYSDARTLSVPVSSLIARAKAIFETRFPEYAQYFDLANLVDINSVTVSYDAAVKVFDSYTATFVDEDGTVLYEETMLEGEYPKYPGKNPSKPADDDFIYTFAGWTDGKNVYTTEFPELLADTTYTATYTSKPNVCEHPNAYDVEATEANCCNPGMTAGVVCPDCGETLSGCEEIPATGNHVDFDGEWDIDETTHFHVCEFGEVFDIGYHDGEATCCSKAVCTVCGATHGDIDPDNHGDTEVRGAVTGNCGEDGYTGDTYCLDCGALIGNGTTIPASENHQGGKATCCTKAVCEICGNEYGNFDADNHGATELRGVVEGNCGVDGYTGDTYCLDCGALIGNGTTIPATGEHIYGDWVVVEEPSETKDGSKKKTCTVCGHDVVETIPATGEQPGTGDATMYIIVASVIAVIGMATVVVLKKRKNIIEG